MKERDVGDQRRQKGMLDDLGVGNAHIAPTTIRKAAAPTTGGHDLAID